MSLCQTTSHLSGVAAGSWCSTPSRSAGVYSRLAAACRARQSAASHAECYGLRRLRWDHAVPEWRVETWFVGLLQAPTSGFVGQSIMEAASASHFLQGVPALRDNNSTVPGYGGAKSAVLPPESVQILNRLWILREKYQSDCPRFLALEPGLVFLMQKSKVGGHNEIPELSVLGICGSCCFRCWILSA